MKNDSADVYKKTLERISFSNYEKLDNPRITCSDFITRLDCIVNTTAPFKTSELKTRQVNGLMEKLLKKYTHEKTIPKKYKQKYSCS